MDYRKLYFAEPEERDEIAEDAIQARNQAIRTVIEETLRLNATKEIYYPEEINGLCRASYWIGDYNSIAPGKRILLLGEKHRKIKSPNVLDLLNFYTEQTPVFLDIFVEQSIKSLPKEELTDNLLNAVRREFSEKCNRENLPFRYHRFDVRNLFTPDRAKDLIESNENFQKEITKPNGFILFLKNESNRNSHIKKERTKVINFLKKRIEDFIIDEFQSIYDKIIENHALEQEEHKKTVIKDIKGISSEELRLDFDLSGREDDFDEEKFREELLQETVESIAQNPVISKKTFESFLLGEWGEDLEMESILHEVINEILVLLTDWYCLLRLFKTFNSEIHPNDSKNCIIYGGDDHIRRYESFFSQNGFIKEYESVKENCGKITLPETPPLFEI
jgi:hypothetical protein